MIWWQISKGQYAKQSKMQNNPSIVHKMIQSANVMSIGTTMKECLTDIRQQMNVDMPQSNIGHYWVGQVFQIQWSS